MFLQAMVPAYNTGRPLIALLEKAALFITRFALKARRIYKIPRGKRDKHLIFLARLGKPIAIATFPYAQYIVLCF